MTTDQEELITGARTMCRQATPGPWSAMSSPLDGSHVIVSEDLWVASRLQIGDASFIAYARTAVPELADALESALRKLAIHEGGLRDDTLRALNRQPELTRERDDARAECERLRKEK